MRLWKDRLKRDRGGWGGIGTIFLDEETRQQFSWGPVEIKAALRHDDFLFTELTQKAGEASQIQAIGLSDSDITVLVGSGAA